MALKIGIDIRLIGKQRTGDEAVFFNLTKELARIDTEHEFELLTDETDKDKLDKIAKKLEIEKKVNFKIVSIKSKNKFLWNFWDLPKYLRANPVNIYLTQYITPFFIPKKIKIVTIIHDISFNFFPQFIRKSDLLFLKMLIPLSIRRADKVLGVSEFTRNEIIRYYKVPNDKVDFFHNAAPENFKREFSSEELEAVREKYGLPEKFILYLGTLQPRKNIPFLIESFAKIRSNLGGIKLVLVGNRKANNFDQKIDKTIEKLKLENDVIFPGFIEEQDKIAVYRLAHVFAFPSLYEGFGIPVLEAFLARTPVLCADIPSLREVAKEGALFADPGDIDKFSSLLYDISIDNDLRESLADSGSRRVGFFSWKKTAEKMNGIFNSM